MYVFILEGNHTPLVVTLDIAFVLDLSELGSTKLIFSKKDKYGKMSE